MKLESPFQEITAAINQYRRKYIDFSVSERNSIALVKLPAMLFKTYVPDGNHEYNRGDVIKIDENKFLFTNWGKIDPNNIILA